MPFASKAQKGYMFANHPKMAREMASKMTPSMWKSMPKRAKMNAIKDRAKSR